MKKYETVYGEKIVKTMSVTEVDKFLAERSIFISSVMKKYRLSNDLNVSSLVIELYDKDELIRILPIGTSRAMEEKLITYMFNEHRVIKK